MCADLLAFRFVFSSHPNLFLKRRIRSEDRISHLQIYMFADAAVIDFMEQTQMTNKEEIVAMIP